MSWLIFILLEFRENCLYITPNIRQVVRLHGASPCHLVYATPVYKHSSPSTVLETFGSPHSHYSRSFSTTVTTTGSLNLLKKISKNGHSKRALPDWEVCGTQWEGTIISRGFGIFYYPTRYVVMLVRDYHRDDEPFGIRAC